MTEITAVTAGGVRLAVSVHAPERGRPLLMIPGLGSARRVYDPIVGDLAQSRTVIVFDPRGIGDSDLGDEPFSMALLADDAVAVIDVAGAARADVWGASMGGMVAQHVAIRHGERVDRLLLAATSPGGAHAVAAPPGNRERLLGRGGRSPEEAYRIACTVLYAEDFQELHPEFIDHEVAERAAHPVRGRAFAEQQRAVRGHDAWDALPLLRMPVLVLHGTNDAVQPVENARAMAQRIPGARAHWFAERGHLFFHEVPHETVEVVDRFLAQAPSRAGR